MRRTIFLFTLCLAVSACVIEPEPINGGRTDSGVFFPAAWRGGANSFLDFRDQDFVFSVRRKHTGFRPEEIDARGAFDLEGWVVYPAELRFNNIVQTYQRVEEGSSGGGNFHSEDSLLWTSDDTMPIEYKDLAGENFSFAAQLAQPFDAVNPGQVDTITDEQDLVIPYARSFAGDTCWWSLQSYGGNVHLFVMDNGMFLDNGTLRISDSLLKTCADSTDIWITLERTKKQFLQSPSGKKSGVASHYREMRFFHMRRKK